MRKANETKGRGGGRWTVDQAPGHYLRLGKERRWSELPVLLAGLTTTANGRQLDTPTKWKVAREVEGGGGVGK